MAELNHSNELKASWAMRHLSFQRSRSSPPLLSLDEVRYVELCTGRYLYDNHDGGGENGYNDNDVENQDCNNRGSGNDDSYTPAARTSLIHLRTLVDGKWRADWDRLLAPGYVAEMPNDGADKVIRLGGEVAAVVRKHGGLSLCRVIEKLQEGKILRAGDNNSDGEPALRNDSVAHSLVFSLLGWLSLLYLPAPAPAHIPAPGAPAHEDKSTLHITLQSRSTLRSHVGAELASRPLDELLRSFGEILPKKSRQFHYSDQSGRRYDDQGRVPTDATDTGLQLEVAQLNVAALQDMANVRIVWVDALSGHLAFDTAGPVPTLCLFKCPSFCKLHHSDASLLATMLAGFYEEDEKPCHDFTAAKLVGEITLSYDLLFRASKRSRKVYADKERARAALTSITASSQQPQKQKQKRKTDPYLDELCGYGYSNTLTASRIFYDAATDFPIFQDRLRRIQDHMKGVQPTGFWALWRDQRDLRLWYTIWVVLILTVVGLIIAVVSAVLAGVQVQWTKKAYNLQVQQNALSGGI